MKTKYVGIITSRKWNIPTHCDCLLADALLKVGIQAHILCWEDTHPWTCYNLLILHSCWDYYLRYEEFCQWLDKLNCSGAHMANGIATIKDNIDKVQQMTLLQNENIPVIPFEVCATVEDACAYFHKRENEQVVVKPSVATSGYYTSLVQNEQELIYAAEAIVEGGKKILVQPYMESICHGEISMIYYHGVFSHAVRRYPGVIAKKGTPVPIAAPEPQWLEIADAVNRIISAKERLYVRIDLIPYHGKTYVMEVELAEPDLYLGLEYPSIPSPLDCFVEEIQKEIRVPISQ